VKALVLDATPLIYLTRVGLSWVFEELEGEKYTPARVKVEVVDGGVGKGVPDALVLEKMFQNRVFIVKAPGNNGFVKRLLDVRGLHVTDAEVIALARELDGVAVIDDEAARKTARIFGVSYVGTPFILMRSIVQGLITKEAARQAIREMISSGWRCDVETYDRIMESIESIN
jgi:predicted nucleic acid-binding protein